MIPYAQHHLEEEDIAEVERILRSPIITQGETIDWLEDEFRKATGSKCAAAVSSGTAALHMALMAAGIKAGDEVIVPSMTFVATANVVKYINAIPVFADIDPETLLIDPEDVKNKITKKTVAIIAVDYAGQPADYNELQEITQKYELILIADACHSLGATYQGKKVGTLAELSCFSLHPTKLITSGEGGIVTTNSKVMTQKIQAFRNHGRIDGDMKFLGFNYRMSDIHAALCINQIKRISELVATRQRLANIYDEALGNLDIYGIQQKSDRTNARHIYVIGSKQRNIIKKELAECGIGSQIHYKPVTLQSYYNCPGVTPKAEEIWKHLLTIPLYPALSDIQQETVIEALRKIDESLKESNES